MLAFSLVDGAKTEENINNADRITAVPTNNFMTLLVPPLLRFLVNLVMEMALSLVVDKPLLPFDYCERSKIEVGKCFIQ